MPKIARLERGKMTEQVECASGLSSKANKDNLIRAASRIIGVEIATHHKADAVFCAIAGILQARASGHLTT